MKFICNKETFLKEITYAADFTNARNALSIGSNIFLSTANSMLQIKATDSSVGFSSTMAVETIENGETTVICEKLLKIIRSIDVEEILIEENGGKLSIKPSNTDSKHFSFQLKTIDSKNFPQLSSVDESQLFTISQKSFMEMCDQTIFSISDDTSRIFLCGIYLERSSTGINCVSTDGKRLSIVERNFDSDIPAFNPIIIPPRIINILNRMSTREGSFSMAITADTIFFMLENHFVYSNLIKGNYPQYRRVIPTNLNYQCLINIDDMLNALNRVSLLVENKVKRIFIEINKSNMFISSEETEIGLADEVISCSYNGPDCKIIVNYSYLMSPLKVMDGEFFTMNFTDPTKAMIIKPEINADYFHVIMPMTN